MRYCLADRVKEIVAKFKENTRFQLKCFQVLPGSAAAVDEAENAAESSEQEQ